MRRELDQAAGATAQQLQGLLGQVLYKAMCWPYCTQSHHPSPIYSMKEVRSQRGSQSSSAGGGRSGRRSGQPFSRSCSTPELCCAPSRAAKATSRSCGYTGGCLPSLVTTPSLLGFLQRGTRKKYYYFVFAPYRQAVQGAMRYL